MRRTETAMSRSFLVFRAEKFPTDPALLILWKSCGDNFEVNPLSFLLFSARLFKKSPNNLRTSMDTLGNLTFPKFSSCSALANPCSSGDSAGTFATVDVILSPPSSGDDFGELHVTFEALHTIKCSIFC